MTRGKGAPRALTCEALGFKATATVTRSESEQEGGAWRSGSALTSRFSAEPEKGANGSEGKSPEGKEQLGGTDLCPRSRAPWEWAATGRGTAPPS